MLLNIIGCLEMATGGRVFIDGTDVTELPDAPLAANQAGQDRQGYNLIPTMTALENVTLPMMFAGGGGKQACERAAWSSALPRTWSFQNS